MKNFQVQGREKRRFWGLMSVAIVLVIIAIFTSIKSREFAEIAFIDVGQGDAACIITPQGEAVVIDGGEDDSFKEDILPFLIKRGIFSVDYVIASHYHSDHADGIVDLLENMPVKNLIIPDVDYDDEAKDEMLHLAENKNIAVKEISAPDVIEVSDGLTLRFLFPNSEKFINSDRNENNDSIVLMVNYFDTSVLFTGDIEKEVESVLVREADIEADILKVGHHGSYTSTSQKFLEEVSPRYAVISVGLGNSHGHPHDAVVKRLDASGARTYRTDRNGNIVFKADKEGLKEIQIEKK